MDANSLIWAVLLPALKKELNFSEILKVTFAADNLNDELTLSGTGFKKGETTESRATFKPMKLSENKGYVDIYLTQINTEIVKAGIKLKKINCFYLRIDCKSKEVETDVFYIDENDRKDSIKIKLK